MNIKELKEAIYKIFSIDREIKKNDIEKIISEADYIILEPQYFLKIFPNILLYFLEDKLSNTEMSKLSDFLRFLNITCQTTEWIEAKHSYNDRSDLKEISISKKEQFTYFSKEQFNIIYQWIKMNINRIEFSGYIEIWGDEYYYAKDYWENVSK